MKYLLRVVRIKRWLTPISDIKSCPSDPLADLNTSSSMFSTFEVENTEDIKAVIIGLFMKKYLDDFGYVLIPPEFIINEEYKVTLEKGTTGYNKADDMHRNIKVTSVHNLIELAYNCSQEGCKKKEIKKKFVKEIIEKAINSGDVKETQFCWKNKQPTSSPIVISSK